MEQIKEVPIGDVKPYENNPRDNDGAVSRSLVGNSQLLLIKIWLSLQAIPDIRLLRS